MNINKMYGEGVYSSLKGRFEIGCPTTNKINQADFIPYATPEIQDEVRKDITTAVTHEQLTSLCNAHSKMFIGLFGKCHPNEPVYVTYDMTTASLVISCARCGKVATRIALSTKKKSNG